MVRNCSAGEAILRLKNTIKKANEPLKKLIESAIANAKDRYDLKTDELKIADIQVGEGMTLKRWTPRAYGRATEILKRSSHIYLTLEAETAGEKKVKIKKKKEAEIADDKTEGKIETVEKVDVKKDKIAGDIKRGYFEAEGKRKESREKGWTKKIFKRKSM